MTTHDVLSVGIDVGGTKVRVGLGTAAGEILRELDEPTHPSGGMDLIHQMNRLVRELAGDALPDVVAVGIASPGAVDPVTGRTRFSQNIDRLDRLDLPGELSALLDRPVVAGNDVNLAAVAEHRLGHGQGCDDLLVVAIGTGIGAGIISGGRLIRGARGAAGEAAELPIAGDPADPEHRRQGLLESQVGTAGYVRRYLDAGGEPVTGGREILRAADDGQSIAIEVTRAVASDVATGIAAIVAIVDPERVVLAGGIGAHPRFADEVRVALAHRWPGAPPLAISALGDRASLVGALVLAADSTV